MLFAAQICHPLSPLPANLALLNQPKEYYLQTVPDLLTLHAKFFMGNLLPQRDMAFLGPRGHQQVDYVWKLQYIRTEYGPSPTLSSLLATFTAAAPSCPAPLLALLPRLLCFNPDLRACTEEAARLLDMPAAALDDTYT